MLRKTNKLCESINSPVASSQEAFAYRFPFLMNDVPIRQWPEAKQERKFLRRTTIAFMDGLIKSSLLLLFRPGRLNCHTLYVRRSLLYILRGDYVIAFLSQATKLISKKFIRREIESRFSLFGVRCMCKHAHPYSCFNGLGLNDCSTFFFYSAHVNVQPFEKKYAKFDIITCKSSFCKLKNKQCSIDSVQLVAYGIIYTYIYG